MMSVACSESHSATSPAAPAPQTQPAMPGIETKDHEAVFSTDRTPPTAQATTAELAERANDLLTGGRRCILGITGTPGAGKSTVTSALLEALGDRAVVVGMDGFHLANSELIRLGRRDRKGAPDTFDVDGYVALLGRLSVQTSGTIYAPRFDRELEDSIGSSVAIDAGAQLVITEGNYLLHDGHGWDAVRPFLDEVWFLDVEPDERRRRLTSRRIGHGHPADEASAWVRDVDEPNARIVETGRQRADLIVRVTDHSASSEGDHS